MATPDVVRLRADFALPHEVLSASDGKALFLRHWPGPSAGRFAVLICHGITAYSEPYGKLVAEELVAAGVDVYGLDLRGHGRSDGVRGDYPSGERWASDVAEAATFLKGRAPTLVVLGHSLGIFSAIAAANHAPSAVDGLVLLSGGTNVRPDAYPKPSAGRALKALAGVALFRHSRLIEYRREGMEGRDDPLFNFRYSARFYESVYGMTPWSVLRMMRQNRIESPNLELAGRPDLPVWVAVGDRDELFTPESTRAFYDQLDTGTKEFSVIAGGQHAYFPPQSWGGLAAWLRAHFPSASEERLPPPADHGT